MNNCFSSQQLLEDVVAVARQAGILILDVYGTDFQSTSKSDASPVTEADELSERLILQALATLTPRIPVVSEETAARGVLPETGRLFWLVDPLDGTKEFIKRNGEFTVNIALIEDGKPVLGVVLAPALNRLFGGGTNLTAFRDDGIQRQFIECRTGLGSGLTVVSSRSHAEPDAVRAFLGDRQIASVVSVGSSLKFCLIASGEADLYPRLGRTMEWDTAAGQAVLTAAGGRVTALDGEELIYGKPGFANPHFIAFRGELDLDFRHVTAYVKEER